MTLAQATKKILLSDPFYGFVLMSLDKEFSNVIDTAGVRLEGMSYRMVVNPDYWEKLTEAQQIEVLKHELLHICFFHLINNDVYEDFDLANIASDAEVNQYLNIDLMNALPGGCIDILSAFPGIKPKAGTQYYYDYLKSIGKNQCMKMLSQSNGNSDGFGDDDEDDWEDSQEYKSIEVQEIKDVNGNNYKFPKIMNHGTWKDASEISKEEKELVKNGVDNILKEAYQMARQEHGNIPGNIVSYIEELMKPKKRKLDWKAIFRRLLGTSDKYELKTTRKRPSKRFEDASGTKHKHLTTLLVAVDTSGSVSDKELSDFFSEIYHIWKTGAEVTIVECDARIQRIYKYKGKFEGKITGRGGTKFNPVVEYYNDHRKEFNTLVYFTDGYANIDFKILGPSIWVITSDGNRNDTFPGKTIYIPTDNE